MAPVELEQAKLAEQPSCFTIASRQTSVTGSLQHVTTWVDAETPHEARRKFWAMLAEQEHENEWRESVTIIAVAEGKPLADDIGPISVSDEPIDLERDHDQKANTKSNNDTEEGRL